MSILIYLFMLLWSLNGVIKCASPVVYNANVGESVTLQFSGGGTICYSTYTLKNITHEMIVIPGNLKYQISSGSLTISNVQATDAGFYASSSNCNSMNSDSIAFYLQPYQNGQPVDASQNFVAIPPFPPLFEQDDHDAIYVVVSDERLEAAKYTGLTGGEITALVIGLVLLLLLTLGIIVLLLFLNRRRKQKREKILGSGKKGGDNNSTSVDYSTIERDYTLSNVGSGVDLAKNTDKDDERKSLPNNRADTSNLGNIVSEINTRDIRGPNVYKPTDFGNLINPQDLPNIDIYPNNSNNNNIINNNKNNSQRSQMNDPSSRFYQNQLDPTFEISRPIRRDSVDANSHDPNSSIIPPPPSKAPFNKVQFPSRNNPNENIHLRQIIKDSLGIEGDEPLEPQRPDQQSRQPQYPSSENLRQIVKDANTIDGGYKNEPMKLPRNPPKPPQVIDLDFDDEGGVTVVSARTPASRNDHSPGISIMPQVNSATTMQQRPPKMNKFPMSSSSSAQQNQNYKNQPHLSFSQRIETTTTPLQIAPSSVSVRTGYQIQNDDLAKSYDINTNHFRDGVTDV